MIFYTANLRRTERSLRIGVSAALIFCVLTAIDARAASWDERLEGTLPLAAPYTLELSDPASGVTSVLTETGDIALRSSDQSSSKRMGRINRGNWPDALGLTAHTRIRFGNCDPDTMGLQVNDGISGGRFRLRYFNGYLNILNATPDPGWPASLSLSVNQWVELWLKITGSRYWLYTFTNTGWSLVSQGVAPAAPGAVYIGSMSNAGAGSMDIDFFRLNIHGAYSPVDSAAPCTEPDASLAVSALSGVVAPGGATQIVVASSENGVLYQMKRGGVNIGAPVAGTGGTINLPTGAIGASSNFSVLATAGMGPSCFVTLTRTASVLVANPVATIAQAKSFADGQTVSLPAKPTSAAIGNSYWLEELDRSSGIRVMAGALPSLGALRQVTGTLTTVAGERRLLPVTEIPAGGNSSVTALGMRSAAVGGTSLNVWTPGVEAGQGVNTIGLLADVWGLLTASQDGMFYVDDGCGLADGTIIQGSPARGLRILGWPEVTDVGAFNKIRGPISSFADAGGKIRPAVFQTTDGCALPSAALAVTVDNAIVCPGQSTTVRVQSSEPGVSYQLRKGAHLENVGAAIAGNGGAIALPTGAVNETTAFDVLATRDMSFCSSRLNSSPMVAVDVPPASSLHVWASINPIDPGGSSVFTVDLSQNGVSYQLLKSGVATGSAVAGTGGSISLPSGPISASSQFTVRATSNSTGCQTLLGTSITIAVNNPVTPYSKVGLHVVCGPRPGYLEFLKKCSDALHPVRMIKCVDDFSPAYDAKQINKYTLTVGRINEAGSVNLGGLDEYVNQPPASVAAFYYSLVKPTWQANPWIDVWEACNEWSYHWAWQADFYIALMDLAEADGFKVALWSASVGNPPESSYPDITRACARAAAHGGHMLALHEYGLWPPSGQQYALLSNAGSSLVTRYRRLYNYLAAHNAVIPLVLTETGQEGGYDFVGTSTFIADYTWYDQEMKKDPYVIGCAAWLLGDCGWGQVSFAAALPALADYISTH